MDYVMIAKIMTFYQKLLTKNKIMQNKKIGILNRGKNNTFANNTFENLDIGIQDEGEETIAEGNEFTDKNSDKSRLNSDKKEELLKLAPEFYGVGINLKTAFKKFKNWIEK